MSTDRPSLPTPDRSPSSRAGRYLTQYFNDRAKDLAEGETLEATFIGPSGDRLVAVALFPLTEEVLGIEAIDARGDRRLMFAPYAPLEFTYRVVRPGDGDTPKRQPLGFHTAPPGER